MREILDKLSVMLPVSLLMVFCVITFLALGYRIYQESTNPNYIRTQDGSLIQKVEIDGHTYLKSGDTLTHAESCSCRQ